MLTARAARPVSDTVKSIDRAGQTKGAPTERREKDKQDGDPEPAEPTRVPEVTAAELSSDEGHNPAPSPNTVTFLFFFFLKTRKSKIKDGAARP